MASPHSSRPPSPADPEASLSSVSSSSGRKRDRTEDDDEVEGKAAKRKLRTKKLTLETVMDKLVAMSTSQTRQGALLQVLPGIRTTIDVVSADVSALKLTTQSLSDTSSLIEKTDSLAAENAALRKSLTALEARVDLLALAGNANALSNHRAHPPHQPELIVSGLNLGTTSSSTLLQLTTAITKTLKVNTSPGDFLGARPLRKAPTVTNPQAPPVKLEAIKTTFAVVCKDHGVVARVLSAKRSHGIMRYSQLDATRLINPDLAAEQSGDPVININELLPSNVLKLLNGAKTQLKPAGFKHIWSRNSAVYARFSDDSLVQIVNTPADIPRILKLYSSQQLDRNQEPQ